MMKKDNKSQRESDTDCKLEDDKAEINKEVSSQIS